MKHVLLCLFSVVVLVGCSPGTFTVRPHAPGTASDGIVYALPKATILISFPYTVATSKRLAEGTYVTENQVTLGAVAVTSQTTPDTEHFYEIQTNLDDAATWKNSFNAELSANLVLTKSGVTTEPVSTAVIKGAIDVLRIFLERSEDDDGGPAAQAEVDKLTATQAKARDELQKLLDAELNVSAPNLEHQKAVDARKAFLEATINYTQTRIQALSTKNAEPQQLTVDCQVPPSATVASYTIDSGTCPELKAFIETAKDPQKYPSSFVLTLDGVPTSSADDGLEEKGLNAFVYRVPYVGTYTLTKADKAVIAQGQIAIPQLGSFGRIFVKPSRFAKHTVELSLHESTGGLRAYTSKREGAAAQSATTGIGEILTALQAARDADPDPTQLAILQTQNTLLEAQIKNIENQRKLEDLLNATQE